VGLDEMWYLRLFGVQILALLLSISVIFMIVTAIIWVVFKFL
jgi:hypothetical protein